MSSIVSARSVLALTLFVVACRTDYVLRQAERATARQSHALALANFNRALSRRSVTDKMLQGQLGEDYRSAVELFLLDELKKVKAERNPQIRLRRLSGLLLWMRRPPLPKKGVRILGDMRSASKAIQKALVEDVEARMAKVAPLLEQRRYYQAYKKTQVLLQSLERGDPERTRLEQIIHKPARTFHAAAAARASEPMVRYFHESMAHLLYGGPQVSGDPKSKLSTPVLETIVEGRKLDCEWAIDPSLLRPHPKSQLILRVNIDACESFERRTIERRTFQYQENVPKKTMVTEQYYERAPVISGCERTCKRFDPLGICVEHQPLPPKCEELKPKLKRRSVPKLVYEPQRKRMEYDAHIRKVGASVSGWMRLEFLDTQEQQAINLSKVHTDQVYWSPEQSDFADGVGPEQLQEMVRGALRQRVNSVSRRAQQVIREHRMNLGRRAAAEARWEQAEARFLEAALGANLSTEANRLFDKRYGIQGRELMSVLYGSAPGLPRGAPILPQLPRPKLDRWQERHQRRRVQAPKFEDRGLSFWTQEEEGGTMVTLGYKVAMSPLRTASRAQGVEASIWGAPVQISFGFDHDRLGGQTRGFKAAGQSYFHLLDNLALAAGLLYEQQTTEQQERYQSFATTIRLAVELFPWLIAQIGADLNLLLLKRAINPGDDDPHYYWPVLLELNAELHPNLYATLSAAHYLGAGSAAPITLSGALGARF